MGKKLLLTSFLICAITLAFSQPPNPGDDNGGDAGPDAPIDGGVSILLIAGAATGAYKAYKSKKKDIPK